MAARAKKKEEEEEEEEKKKKKKTFKRHLLRSQCPDFKVISQKCSSYGPLSKLLKQFSWAKQNGRQS